MTGSTATERAPLTRDRILEAALAYVDAHGLAALSMHKLGAALGVKAMSLYNHVGGKGEILDGIVELLWTEVERAAPAPTLAGSRWQDSVRTYARATRAVMRAHPAAAPLVTGQRVMPVPALRLVQTHLAAAVAGGLPEPQANALLRTVTVYALGSALTEISWGGGSPGCQPAVQELLRPGTPAELANVAHDFCGRYDPAAEFELGLDLMLHGMDAAGRHH